MLMIGFLVVFVSYYYSRKENYYGVKIYKN